MLTRERLQKTSRGWERRPRMINRDTLYFVSTTSPNFCSLEEVSKFAVSASDINKAKEYTFKGQAIFLTLEGKHY